MTLTEALSDKHISAMIDAVEIGKDKLGSSFSSATVKKMMKSGFVAEIKSKDGRKHMLTVKYDGTLKIIRFK